MEPITTLAASAIVKLAFDEFIKTGAGEVAKKSLAGTGNLVKVLQDRIRLKFEESEKEKAILVEVKDQRTPKSLDKLTEVLCIAMAQDKAFTSEIQQISHQIINIQNQNQSTTDLKQQNINQGRDQFILNQPHGEIRLGG